MKASVSHWDGSRLVAGAPVKRVAVRAAAPEVLEELDICHIISVDPGANSAWALWKIEGLGGELLRLDRNRVREGGSYRSPTVVECLALMGELQATLFIDWSQALCLVEGQYYAHRKGPKARPSSPWNDVERIIESRCAWQDAARIIGAQVETAAPGIWIKSMTKGFPGATSKDRISASLYVRLPGLSAVKDEHDAVLLGCWWLEERGIRPRMKGR